MNQETLERLIADYLDDLLDGDEARAAEQAIAEEPALVARIAQQRAQLYHPFAVAPPAADLPQRIVARHNDRPLGKVVRYAAVFAAGVLSTLLVGAASAEEAPVLQAPGEPATVLEAPADTENNTHVVVMRRRIR